METAITGLIIIGLLILVVVGVTTTALTTQASLAESSRVMQERAGERVRTNVSPLNATTSAGGDYVYVTFKNIGTTKLTDFNRWDVILQYTGSGTGQVRWYPYGAGANHWTEQIYQIASPPTAETFEPGVLNPGEELVVTVNVSPVVDASTINLATVSTPNGISASMVFTR
ncbi:MAG: hypothetical protein HY868_11340 [Chloroflexi bacterium]|nr:hypothetical protein [Chloroflexota bacterium]